MSALADALVAAQRRALAATQKAYVAGHINHEDAVAEINAYGLTDQVDIDFLLASLDVVRLRGAELPAEGNGTPAQTDSPATDAQRARVYRDLEKTRGQDIAQAVSREPSLTKAQASEIIDSIAKGSYDAAKWEVPF